MVIGSDARSRLPREELVLSVSRAVVRAKKLAHIESLILWPPAEPGLTRELAGVCRAAGVTPLLWFPVLSDSPGVPQPEDTLVMSCDGTRGHGRSGAWEGLAGGEERFLFSCPNNAGYLDSVLRAFAKLLDETDMGGVMLDKIRFPGPSNGFESLVGCFCSACCARFERETGGSFDTLRQEARSFLQELRSSGPARLLSAWKESSSFWKAAGLEELGSFRERSILAAVQRFSELAHERRLEVGLDLFSPSLASVVGQDYAGLSRLCDWMKPMLYCRAVGPAGLPLEILSLWKALQVLHPPADPALIRAGLEEVFGWSLPDTETELLAHGVPAAVISSELARIASLSQGTSGRVCAGIEAVRIPSFGIDTTPEILRASLSEVRASSLGVIASWSLFHIPEDNLRVLGEWEGQPKTGPAKRA
jgi:hypothetical protein